MAKHYKLDKKGKKLLWELMKDARAPATNISKVVGLSKESVIYRIKKLKKEKVIQKFEAVIDSKRLGFNKKVVFLRTKLSEKEKQQLTPWLIKHSNVSWISYTTGKWDLLLHLVAKDDYEFDTILTEIFIKTKIKDYCVCSSVDYFYNPGNYLGVEPKLQRTDKPSKALRSKVKIDQTDIKLLKNLATDCRESFVSVGNKIGVSADTVKYRVNNLIKQGIIKRFRTSINSRKLGFQWNSILLKVVDLAKEDELIDFLYNHKNINGIFKQIGEYNINILSHTENSDEFNLLVTEIMSKFPDMIADFDTLYHSGEEYFTYFTECMEKENLE